MTEFVYLTLIIIFGICVFIIDYRNKLITSEAEIDFQLDHFSNETIKDNIFNSIEELENYLKYSKHNLSQVLTFHTKDKKGKDRELHYLERKQYTFQEYFQNFRNLKGAVANTTYSFYDIVKSFEIIKEVEQTTPERISKRIIFETPVKLNGCDKEIKSVFLFVMKNELNKLEYLLSYEYNEI